MPCHAALYFIDHEFVVVGYNATGIRHKVPRLQWRLCTNSIYWNAIEYPMSTHGQPRGLTLIEAGILLHEQTLPLGRIRGRQRASGACDASLQEGWGAVHGNEPPREVSTFFARTINRDSFPNLVAKKGTLWTVHRNAESSPSEHSQWSPSTKSYAILSNLSRWARSTFYWCLADAL
ncbi:uncharacterized protein BDR25DRAFT_352096 [Lindgomyces ingoldianus]|uniref:Uncharacterized protein n=1 Tax=Lindgomyces ingoldianus TaxID=673940 RepID=A0ACB6R446_9PLEO|nr:uncharacterized protein BDR25DRAFT_352096 [Lindgomyces ingoldianus]KAF2473603.1 hypothetical protein BDR25DRAFT_352096 [Lindgomyces ingoldianus]